MKRLLAYFALAAVLYADPSAEQIEFFENRIRPVLAQECYECHSSTTKQKGGLTLDTRAGWQAGGDSGPVILPGRPHESVLLKSLRHEDDELKMPKAGAKLDDSAIADIQKWIAMGAPDPRESAPTADQLRADTDWAAVAKRRTQWWSFQPVTNPPVPGDDGWSSHPVDRFLRTAQKTAGLQPAPDAAPEKVLRRLHYVLTGLPPSAGELASLPSTSFERTIESLLASPHFGERWARHWMDWFRYAEGHGGQGDPVVENAFEYRDYLIRALNSNVPYDRLIREHLAGDLLPQPRLGAGGLIDESRIGLAHFRFVEHGYFPVDALDELVKFTDNQIDVVSKATLGLTVSCARCHDHKFDAISQRDYHALFGIFASSRPAQRPLLPAAKIDARRGPLQQARAHLMSALKTQWLAEAAASVVSERLAAWSLARRPQQTEDAKVEAGSAAKPGATRPKAPGPGELLHAWDVWRERGDLAELWTAHPARLATLRRTAATHNDSITLRRWDLRPGLPADWYVADGTLTAHGAGELGLGVLPKDGVVSILPAGLATHGSTAFEQAAIASHDFIVPDGAFALRWAGAGGALARISAQNYPIHGAQLHRQFDVAEEGATLWFSRETDYWKDQRGYFHVMTRHTATAPSLRGPAQAGQKNATPPRGSWFSLAEVRLLKQEKDQIKEEQFAIAPLFAAGDAAPSQAEELAARYAAAVARVLQRWQTDAFTDEDALFLTACLKAGLIRGQAADLAAASAAALAAYRQIEDEFSAGAARAAPGVIESPGFDQPLYPRGNHLAPGAPVPRAFLAALGGKPYPDAGASGRLPLALELTRPDNPLFARVIANRLWHHVFGRGLVTTTDNFGRNGQPPTHPELLDHLAARLIRTGFDLKDGLRYLVSTRTFRLSSLAPPASVAADPANRLLTHAPVRRMEAEIIRDHLLAVSGNLVLTLYGPSTSLKAPPPADTRRGLYVQTKRQGQNEFFATFDVPVPNTTRGVRGVTTTPGQSIALLNSPFIQHQARNWATRALAAIERGSTVEAELHRLIAHAFTRPARDDEIAALRAYRDSRSAEGDLVALQHTAHLLFNLKEFIFVP